MKTQIFSICLMTLALVMTSCAGETVPPFNPPTNGAGYVAAVTDTDTIIASVHFDWLLLSDANWATPGYTNWNPFSTNVYVAGQTNYVAPMDIVPVNTRIIAWAIGTNGMKSLSTPPVAFTLTNSPSTPTPAAITRQ